MIYVDESKARGYILAVAFVPARSAHALRTALRGLRGRGRRSIHFHGTTDAQRNAVIKVLFEHEVAAVVVRARSSKGNNPRQECIRATAAFARATDAHSITLDRDESLERLDRRWLFEELAKTSIRYDHADRHSDALLWVPDAIAWCWQRGGEWRSKVRDAVVEVIDIDGP